MRCFLLIIILLHSVLFCESACALEGLARFQGNNVVFLETAVTSEEKSKGLMDRTSLGENRGMVFIFRPAKEVTFWMKNTLIPLDMIFIKQGRIIKIVENAIPNQTEIVYPSEGKVTEVVEVNGGYAENHNIMVGDPVVFENIPEIDYSLKSKLMIKKR